MRLSLLLLLVACKGPDDTEPADTEPVVDTETDEVIFENSYVGFVTEISGVPRHARAAIGIVRVDMASGAPVLGETLISTPLSGGGTFALGVPDEGPPAEQIGPVLDHAGLEGAWYVPLLYVDTDQDGVYDAGEAIAGVPLNLWLGWHQGTLPSGWPEGWTLLTVDLGAPTADPSFQAIGTEAEITLRGGESYVELEGEWAGSPSNARLVAIDDAIATGGTPSASRPMDVAVTAGAYDVDIDDRPGGDHFDTTNPNLWYALEALLAYEDSDESGAYDHGADKLVGGVCWNGQPLWLRFVAPPTAIGGALALEAEGWATGWRAVQIDENDVMTELSSVETELTVVDAAACPAPF